MNKNQKKARAAARNAQRHLDSIESAKEAEKMQIRQHLRDVEIAKSAIACIMRDANKALRDAGWDYHPSSFDEGRQAFVKKLIPNEIGGITISVKEIGTNNRKLFGDFCVDGKDCNLVQARNSWMSEYESDARWVHENTSGWDD